VNYLNRYLLACLAGCLVIPAHADDDIKQLRQQLELLKQEYAQKINALEQRLEQAEQDSTGAAVAAPAEHQTGPEMAATADVNVVQQTPAAAGGGNAANQFNPAISLILDGRYSHFSQDPEDYRLPGFMLGEEAGPGEQGFALGESELVISANADDKFFGRFTASFGELDGETEVAVEEAFLETLGLDYGLTVKGGRFYSGIGYLNSQHSHQWDFADAPLIYRGLFGNQLVDDGVQFTWLAPVERYLAFGAEAFRATAFPLSSGSGNRPGAYTLFAKTGGDVGFSHSWLAGVSYLDADTDFRQAARGPGGEADGPAFGGNSNTWGVDLVWKWAPNGNRRQRNLQIQYEYYRRDDDGQLTTADKTGSFHGRQSGWYAQAVYQFIPRWRIGLRYDALDSRASGSDQDMIRAAGLDNGGHTPKRYSLMTDWSNSEFSRLRLQYNRDESSPDTDDQLLFQYILSLGAHGAHQY
jgi:hypothetical protein